MLTVLTCWCFSDVQEYKSKVIIKSEFWKVKEAKNVVVCVKSPPPDCHTPFCPPGSTWPCLLDCCLKHSISCQSILCYSVSRTSVQHISWSVLCFFLFCCSFWGQNESKDNMWVWQSRWLTDGIMRSSSHSEQQKYFLLKWESDPFNLSIFIGYHYVWPEVIQVCEENQTHFLQ